MHGLFCVNHHLAKRRVSSKFVAKLAIAPAISATPKFRCVNGIELTCQQECIYRVQRFQKSVRANPFAQLQEIAHIKGLRSVYGYVQYMSMRNFSSISEAVLAKLKIASIYSLLFNSIPAMPKYVPRYMCSPVECCLAIAGVEEQVSCARENVSPYNIHTTRTTIGAILAVTAQINQYQSAKEVQEHCWLQTCHM